LDICISDIFWVLKSNWVIRLCGQLQRTALLARQSCARQFFGNCPIRVDTRFCTARAYTDKSRRCECSTLEGRTKHGPDGRWSDGRATRLEPPRQSQGCPRSAPPRGSRPRSKTRVYGLSYISPLRFGTQL
jgi:hypothetical protein